MLDIIKSIFYGRELTIGGGKPRKEISEEIGISLSSVRRLIKKYNISMIKDYNMEPVSKEDLESMISEGMSIRQISKKKNKSLTSIRHWFKIYGLKSEHFRFKDLGEKEYGKTRFCPRCKKDIPTKNFHQRRGKENGSTYCKPCTSDQTLERMRSLKSQMIEYKGGCCVRCGYDKYQGALEFHHIDPKMKDFTPSHLRKYSFDDRVKKELDKCILVCSNCHREIHHEMKIDERKK